MFKRILCAIVFLAVIFFALTGFASADGGFFHQLEQDIYEPQQKAVILYHDGTKEMHLSVEYDGAADEFAWLVPTPVVPQVEESDSRLFSLMSAFTPAQNSSQMKGRDYLGGLRDAGVDVIDQMTVGAFDITVVRSEDADELRTWLQDRGFAYDDKADSVLGDYIAQGWCFTAMRINPNASVTESLLKQGAINPLRFTFKSDKLVYPLHISSLNPGPSEVLLYVLADKAYEHRTATLEFADSWQGNQVKVLEQFSDVAGQLEKAGGCFLTKLRGTYQPEDMKDLYLVPAGKESLQLWPASLINHQSTTGSHLPLWALVLMLLVAAALAALFLQRALPALFGSPARMLIVLLVLFIAMSGILVPLTLNSRDGNQEAA